MNAANLHHENFALENVHGDIIFGDIRYHDDGVKKPCVIICHSFMAFKNWGFFPYLSRRIAEAGFVSVIFNLSLNGVEGDGNRITDFDRFARNTFTRELEDVQTVVDACVSGIIGRYVIDVERIGLLGHSRGGGIAIVHSANDKRIQSLVTLSSIATFDRWREDQKTEWKKHGVLPLAKDSTVSPLRLGLDLLNDLETNSERLNIIQAASQISIPWQIVHGKADVTVSCKEAEALYQASNKTRSELLLLEKVGHLYNAATQEEDKYQTLDRILEQTIQFTQRTL
ncbi:MAG: dienelactone hydrolase family protein [Ignavibacteriae bacterium]|nr:dienelactone hydrolase family protein [Ignavibacteriota bacterium]